MQWNSRHQRHFSNISINDSCPLCKGEFKKSNLKKEKDLKAEIEAELIECNCKESIRLNEWNEHSAKCESYQSAVNKIIKEEVVKDVKK